MCLYQLRVECRLRHLVSCTETSFEGYGCDYLLGFRCFGGGGLRYYNYYFVWISIVPYVILAGMEACVPCNILSSVGNQWSIPGLLGGARSSSLSVKMTLGPKACPRGTARGRRFFGRGDRDEDNWFIGDV